MEAKKQYKKYGIPCISQFVVDDIMKKYGLVLVGASNYTGEIPDKNIEYLFSAAKKYGKY
jgi:hypothetical protein